MDKLDIEEKNLRQRIAVLERGDAALVAAQRVLKKFSALGAADLASLDLAAKRRMLFDFGAHVIVAPAAGKREAPSARCTLKMDVLSRATSTKTEASEGSGVLITTRFAAEQGRDVFAVPGNIVNRSSVGCNRLVQDGATMVLKTRDITTELNLHLVPRQRELREALPENASDARLLAELDEAGEPRHIDELCRTTGLPVAEISGTLVMMQLAGPMTYALAR
jgi:hypothetical protein